MRDYFRGVVLWLGHFQVYFLAVSFCLTSVSLFFPAAAWLSDLSLAAVIAWIAAYIADDFVHRRRLCERCIAGSPDDPQAAVRRWKPLLCIWHHHGLRFLLFAVLVGCLYGSSVLRFPHPAVIAFNLCLLGWICCGYLSSSQHLRLGPWCPWCRWGEGGAEEMSPALPQTPLSV